MHCDECIAKRTLVASENRKYFLFLNLFWLLPVLPVLSAAAEVQLPGQMNQKSKKYLMLLPSSQLVAIVFLQGLAFLGVRGWISSFTNADISAHYRPVDLNQCLYFIIKLNELSEQRWRSRPRISQEYITY